MFRRVAVWMLLGLAALSTLLAPLSLQAQDDWFVLLFNSMTKTFMRVHDDGTQETFSLDLPSETYLSAREAAFSPTTDQIAFCVTQYSADNVNSSKLYVRDLEAGTTLVERDMGNTAACRVTGNEDMSLISVGIIRNPFSENEDQPASWELLILDTETGETLHSLTAETPLGASLEYRYGAMFLPYVLHFQGREVIFGEVPYGTEFPPDFPTYAWNLDTDALEPVKEWGYPFSAHLDSTGETAWLAQDESLPAGEPFGPVPPNNIVNVTDTDEDVKVVYYSPDWILTGVEFMEGGERLLLQLSEPFDPNAPNAPPHTRWITLDRDGNKTELLTSENFTDLTPAPGGYLVFTTASPTLPATYTLDYHGAGGIETLLSLETDLYGAWEVVYVTADEPRTDLPPFTEITPAG